MAAGTKLQLVFTTDTSTTTHTYNYADPAATKANVVALATTIIAGGAIFTKVPLALKSAKTITTSENIYDLSDNGRNEPLSEQEARALGIPVDDDEIKAYVEGDRPYKKDAKVIHADIDTEGSTEDEEVVVIRKKKE